MSDQRNGGIAWTEQTWNPLRGCSRLSPACANCYAEAMAARFCGPGQPYEGTINPKTKRWNGKIRTVPDKLDDPLRWSRPRMVFVNSMSDLFHEGVPDVFIAEVFNVMYKANQHTFQVLTKRPARMLDWISRSSFLCNHPLPNVWLGVTAENQETADERIPLLLQTPAAVRWVSVEPMLGPIDASFWLDHLPALVDQCPRLDWVVCGGESGQNARPMHPDWPRGLRDQCRDAGVPFLFKQWGEWSPQDPGETSHKDCAGVLPSGDCKLYSQGYVAPFDSSERLARAGNVRLDGRMLMFNVGKKRAGRLLDGVLHDEYPQVCK